MNFVIPKKQPPSRSQRKKDLHRLLVARSDIGAAVTTCRLFADTVKSISDDLYYPLYAAIVVCYARPFTNNEPYGALPKKWATFDDAKDQETHDRVMKARHELIAHSDSTVRKAMIVPKGAVVGKLKDRELKSASIGTQTSFYFFPLPFFGRVEAIAANVGRRLNAEVEAMVQELYGGMDLPARKFALRINDGF